MGINRIRLEFKVDADKNIKVVDLVLIESDWNLKEVGSSVIYSAQNGINRIRLEFKGFSEHYELKCPSRINRIRLEFKVFGVHDNCLFTIVLIESDWNLKSCQALNSSLVSEGINRIRLEFKVKATSAIIGGAASVLIESDWNLKKTLRILRMSWHKY